MLKHLTNKKIKKIIGLSILIIIIFSILPLNISYAKIQGKINAPGVRFRSGPSTEYRRIKSLYVSDVVEIIGREGDWYKVKNGGDTGYVLGEFVNQIGNAPIPNLNAQQTENDDQEEENINDNIETSDNKNDKSNEQKTDETSENKTNENDEVEKEEIKKEFISLNKNVSLKNLPTYFSNTKLTAKKNEKYKVSSKKNHWIKIQLENGSEGWILESEVK